MKDVQGKTLQEGQKIAYSSSGQSGLYIGTVLGFTAQRVIIKDPWGDERKKKPETLVIIK